MVITHSWLFLAALFLGGCGATATPPAAASAEESIGRDAADLFRRGQEAAQRGDTLRAEQYLALALDSGFDDRRVLPIMLQVCLSSSRLRAALNHAEPYLSKHPNDRSLRYLVATIHLGLGQLDNARIDLNYLLRLDPKDVNAHYLLGILEAGAAPDRARAHFGTYLDLAPTGPHAVEVRSRLTNLEIRGDLNQGSASTPNFGSAIAPALESIGIQAHTRESVTWFGTGQAAASESSKDSP